MDSDVILNINEIFGPTIQGEGPNSGRLASFVRLAGCNLTCDWCDTPYTWDWSRHDHGDETHPIPVEQVAEQVDRLPGRVIVSGGEPLLQPAALAALLTALPDRNWDVETNGTRSLGPTADLWDTIICSPKVMPSARQPQSRAGTLSADVLTHSATHFKFPIADQADLTAVLEWLALPHHGRSIPLDRIWLMPEGTDAATITERTGWIAEAAVAHQLNFSSRLHVIAWGAARAR